MRGGGTIPRPFSKKSKLSIAVQIEIIETKPPTTCVYLIKAFFKKQKEV